MSAALEPSEDDEQRTYFAWLDYVRISGRPLRSHVYAVPNGGKRSRVEAAILKGLGVTPGVPDISVDVPSGDFHGLRIEMKRRTGGVTSAAQIEQMQHRMDMDYCAIVCHGFDMARLATKEYLRASWDVKDAWKD